MCTAGLKRRNVSYNQLVEKLVAIGQWTYSETSATNYLERNHSGVLDPMLRGYRGVIFAACFGLTLIGASNLPQDSTNPTQGNGNQANRQQSASAAAANSEPAVPPPSDAGCERNNDQRSSDLCAQWKAADAAYDSARWAWWQLLLGGVGLILGAATMAAAIFAALYAKRAAVATEQTVKIAQDAATGAGEALMIAERNANAAAEQVKVAKETAHRQLRPYILPATLGVLNSTTAGGWKIWTGYGQLRNQGETPAVIVSIQLGKIYVTGGSFEESLDKIVWEDTDDTGRVFGTGTGTDINVPFS
jgi:hypothetical protein